MTADPLQLVEDRLADTGHAPRRRGEKIIARCPAHPDRTPSLSVTRGTQQPIILNCLAGCATDAVLEALGISWADISAPVELVEHRVTATYPYLDEHGTILYHVERIEPGYDGRTKSFRQAAPGRKGPGAMNGIRRVPYRLPAVIDAVAAGDPIYLCEGEKDADAIVALGHCATTNSGGADAWDAAFNTWLTDAKVIIVVDRDPAGYKRGHKLLEQLRHVTTTVAVVQPTVGKDIYDHLHAGKTLADVEKLSADTLSSLLEASNSEKTAADNPDTPRLAQYLVDWSTAWNADTSAEWLIEPFIARGRAHTLYAGAKTGKSLVTLYAVAAATLGESPFGLAIGPEHPIKVLYIDMEMTLDDLLERLSDMGWENTQFPNLHYLQLPNLKALDTIEGGSELVNFALHLGVDLVVIDTTSRVISGEENSADTFRWLYMYCIQPLKAAGVATLRLDHAGKDVSKGTRGSSAKNDDVDVVYRLDRAEAGFSLHTTHRRMGWIPEYTAINMSDDPLRFTLGLTAVPEGTKELIDHLTRLGVRTDASVRVAGAALHADGIRVSQRVLAAALKARRHHRRPAVDVEDDIL